MLLALDVGNTNVSIGLYRGAELVAHWRVATEVERTADELAIMLDELFRLRGRRLDEVGAVVIGSVVPSLNHAFREAALAYLQQDPLVVGPGTRTGVRIRYENPKDVGADRIANAVAAVRLFGGPVVVIDFGTAVTYDAISAEGDYLGGAIAPGIQVSHDALVTHTAKLPRVEAVAPEHVIGRTTDAAVRSGLMWGFVAQVEGMVARMVGELGGSARVVATGGQAAMVASLTATIDVVEPLLTLEGLRLIHDQNAPDR